MVNLQIVSDLHLETFIDTPSALSFITPSADILILAGDIGRLHRYDQLYNFLREICPFYQAVLYVLGNHEYYRVDGVPDKTMEQLFPSAERLQKDIPNLYILNRNSVSIGDVCIIGCTLWSRAMCGVPPFIVRVEGMTSDKYNGLFYQDLAYVEKMIEYCRSKKMKLVVVTHHCPSYSVTRRKYTDRYKSLYASNLDHLLDRSSVHTWICGHVHQNFDFYTTNGTHLVSNQRGKPKDNVRDFSLNKVITV